MRIPFLPQKKKAPDTKEKGKKTEEILPVRPKLQKKPVVPRRRRVEEFLGKSGIRTDPQKLGNIMVRSTIVLNIILGIGVIFHLMTTSAFPWWSAFSYVLVIWSFSLILTFFSLWLFFYMALDLRMYQRRKNIEEVLPDFLELASANINAGMTIDRALWYAVRPRFGVLAKEIETVAKQTMSGEELIDALKEFSSKYDSTELKRSVNLLSESINAGGEIGNLLNRIATNIKESQILKKEMAANITNYAIFITFAAVVAAPILLGLASQLLEVIRSIMSSVNVPSGGSGMQISFDGVGITQKDFMIFAMSNLTITTLFSAVIVATIRKGNIKESARYIPFFVLASLAIFFAINTAFKLLLGSFFQ